MAGYEAERKIAIMGYRSVGKSSLTLHFVEGRFIDSYDPTIENTFSKQATFFGRNFNLNLVDTAGQDQYSEIPRRYSMDVHGYVFVYAITSQQSFDVVKDIRYKVLDANGDMNVPILLVGNKTDLNLSREVQTSEGQNLAKQWGVPFLEVSAMDKQAATQVFEAITREIERAQGNLTRQNDNKCTLS